MNLNSPVVVGIFVGGSSRRMGGVPKGLLPAPDGSKNLVERLVRVAREALPQGDVVLVGSHEAYVSLGVAVLNDDPAGVGPIGGLSTLLRTAAGRGADAIALACDLPHVTSGLIARIAQHAPESDAVAPRPGGVWQPLCARYSPPACLPILADLIKQRRYALHGLLDVLGNRAAALPLEATELHDLDDWDTPEQARSSR